MAPRTPAPQASAAEKPLLKILLLHGYTQSGPSFHTKTRALQKHIQKMLPNNQVEFTCPSAPVVLKVEDIPQYDPSQGAEQFQDCHGWWLASPHDEINHPMIDRSVDFLVQLCDKEGPFDGIIGFSQGACIAAMLVSLHEKDRKAAFERYQQQSGDGIMPFPDLLAKGSTKQPPFKFLVSYSGFAAAGPRFHALYSEPKVTTPILHFYGEIDSLVSETKIRTLVAACAGDPEKEGRVISHPGGHVIPFKRVFMDNTADFIKGLVGPKPSE